MLMIRSYAALIYVLLVIALFFLIEASQIIAG